MSAMNRDAIRQSLSASAQVPKQVPKKKDLGVSAPRMERFLTRTFVPTVGLHLSLLAAIFLFATSQLDFDGLLWLFLFAFCVVALRTFVLGLSTDPIAASRQTTALFVLGFLVLMSSGIRLPDDLIPGLPLPVALLALGYALVAGVAFRVRIQALSIVVIASYSLILAYAFSNGLTFFPLAGLFFWCTVIGGLCLKMRGELSYLIGFVVAGLIVVVLSVTENDLATSAEVLAGFGAIVVVAFVAYELFTHQSTYSDLVRFIGQGVIVALLLFVTGTIFDDSAFMVTAMLFGAYTAASWSALGPNGRETRMLWCIIIATVAVLSDTNAEGIPAFAICAGGLFVAVVMSAYADNRFARIMAILLAALFVTLLVSFVFNETENLTAEMRAVIDGDSTVPAGALIADAHWNFVFAVALLATPIVIAVMPPVSKGTAWWRGLIRPRFVVLIRNVYRAMSKRIQSAPLVGWIIGLIGTAWKAVGYLKSRGSIALQDLLGVACLFVGASLMQGWLDVWWVFEALRFSAPDDTASADAAALDAMVVAWVTWGFVAAAFSYFSRELLYRFVAFALFVTPSVLHGSTLSLNDILSGDAQFLRMVVFSALAIYLTSLVPVRLPAAASEPPAEADDPALQAADAN
ncbi:MAG: hypothetical protein AAFN94_06860 [Pseudomonadota bacterium]